ncbi:MAG: hypothetical protein ABI165_03615, partial [Bryobacteraceae bacterium]
TLVEHGNHETPHNRDDRNPEAFEQFRNAMKTILLVPKSVFPSSPFKQHTAEKKKPAARKGWLDFFLPRCARSLS